MIRTFDVERLAFFRPRLPSDAYVWVKALLLVLVAVQAVRLVWAVVTPVGPFGDWRPAAPRTLSAEARTAVFSSLDPFFRTAGSAVQAAAPATGLQLFGTREGSGSVRGSAILGQSEADQKSYVVGEEVAPGVKLSVVSFDHVVLDRGGAKETLYMPGMEEGSSGGPSAASTGAGAPGANLANAFDLKPRTQNGQVTGVAIGPGSNPALFQAAGFRPGDVIVAVNGARIASLIDIQQLQSNIAPGARLTLTVERGGQTLPIALNLPVNQ